MGRMGWVVGTVVVSVAAVLAPPVARDVRAEGPPAVMAISPGATAGTTALERSALAFTTQMATNAAFSAAVGTSIGGPGTAADMSLLLGDWDGREDLAVDHDGTVRDRSADANPLTEYQTRFVPSPITKANGMGFNILYGGDSVGNFRIFADLVGDLLSDVEFIVNLPTLVATGTSNGFNLAAPIVGDATSGSVVVTGIAVSPVADLGDFGPSTCDTLGEVIYVSVYDPAGGSVDALARPIHTRIFAFSTFTIGGTTFINAPVLQLVRSHLANFAGVAVDDSGSLYFQLIDPTGGAGGAVFKAAELPRTVCAAANRTHRALPEFLSTATIDLTSPTPVDLNGVHLTNYSGTSFTFGNIAALASGPCNTLYAAVSRSRVGSDDAATQATEGPFPSPAEVGPTPAMIISFADGAGAVDGCFTPGGSQPGLLPIGDGFADVAQAGLALAPGVNNFRAFALGTGPDVRAAGNPVFGSPSNTLKLEFQVDFGVFSGITVDEEDAVHVISGGTPAGVDTNPSAALGEILKFPDRAPSDRRSDFVDLRGDGPPTAPNTGDGDSDRFDHLFFQAPPDGSGMPTGLAGLSRGFLLYINRPWPTPPTGLTVGAPQGDDDTDGPIAFEGFDPSGQVSGGDDANAPATGDDASGGFEFSFGGYVASVCTQPWTQFFLNSNGNVTFGAGSTDNTPNVVDLLRDQPRVAPAWHDTNPNARAVSLINFPLQALGFAGPNAFKVRWIDVPQFGSESCGAKSTFSVTLYDDGTGVDESAPPTVEGPTSQRFLGGAGAPPRADGRGPVHFQYCRMDNLGSSGSPVIAGYAQGEQDFGVPFVCETDWSAASRAAELASGLVGDGTQRVLFELFDEGVVPAPQQAGSVDLDLRFESNDPALTSPATQPDPSRDDLDLFGADCSANAAIGCSCVITVSPFTLPDGSVFNQQLSAEGGTDPHTFAVTSGALPGGVALGADGTLAGSSTSTGAFSFEVTASDTNMCTGRRTYSVNASCAAVANVPSITCRLDVLVGNINGLAGGKLQSGLLKILNAAKEKVGASGSQTGKKAKRSLGKAAKLLKKFNKKLNSKGAKRDIPDDVRAALQAAADAIRADAVALKNTL